MSGGQLLIVAIAVGMLVGVIALTAVQLRSRRGRWPLVAAGVVFYLVVGNLVSRMLVGVIYPANPRASEVGQLLVLQIAHSTVSLAVAAGLTVLGIAGLRRVLPRSGPSAG